LLLSTNKPATQIASESGSAASDCYFFVAVSIDVCGISLPTRIADAFRTTLIELFALDSDFLPVQLSLPFLTFFRTIICSSP